MSEAESRVVVIVEDDTSVNRSMTRLLRLAGFHPVTYFSAEALFDSPPSSDVACFVVDVQLPGQSGFALRDSLAKSSALPPVIFITAFDEPDARARAARAGAVAFLAKPFTGRVLLDTIASAMHASR